MQEMYVVDENGKILTWEEVGEIYDKQAEEARLKMIRDGVPVPDMSFLEPPKI